MPIPTPNDGESHDKFMDRCMGDSKMMGEFKEDLQRMAVCESSWSKDRNVEMGEEKRAFRCDELRAMHGNKLIGHAAVYGVRSQRLAFGYEVVERGAFQDALSGLDDVRALVEHNPEKIIGRVPKTMKLSDDGHGLRVEIDVAQTSFGRDIIESVERGDVDSMSFGFRVVKDGDTWTWQKDGTQLRTLSRVRILDVSVVAYPAYVDTDIAVRSLRMWQAVAWEPDAITRAYVERAEKMKQKFAVT